MLHSAKKQLTSLPIYMFSSAVNCDIAIIGGGPGGYVAALKAGQLGFKTVCIENRGRLGGTCLNVGCIPSKTLLHVSHKFHDANKVFKNFGLAADNVRYDWTKVQQKKDDIIKSLTDGIEGLFKKNKVQYIKGTGSLQSANEISVETFDKKQEIVNAKHIILATGSDASPFPGLPFDEEVIWSSTGALNAKKVPKKLIVIGAGVIGLELGSVYQRMGTQVTVLEYQPRITPGLDNEITNIFHNELKKQGLKIQVGTKVINGEKTATGIKVNTEAVKGGKKQSYEADALLVATGRRPYSDKLGLDKLNIKVDKQGRVETNARYQTNIPNIYAIGDLIKGPMLAHKAEEEGLAVVENLKSNSGHVNYHCIPGVIYTDPEVATIGYTEEEVKEKKIVYSIGKFPYMANSRAKAIDEVAGMVKIITEKKTDKIIGCHICGSGAGEMIAEVGFAMENGATSEDIARCCHAHPTLSEGLREACLGAHFKCLHI